MKIRPVAVELFHTEKRMDMTKLADAFRNLRKAPKNRRTLIKITVTPPMNSFATQILEMTLVFTAQTLVLM